MIAQAAFALATIAVLALVYHSGSPGLIRSGWVLATNLALVWLGTWWFDSFAPWGWFIVIDLASGFAIVAKPSGRLQAYVGGVYFIAVFISTVFGLSGASPYGVGDYLNLLAFGGACQLLILATGAIHGRGRKVDNSGSGIGRAGGAVAAHSARLDAGP